MGFTHRIDPLSMQRCSLYPPDHQIWQWTIPDDFPSYISTSIYRFFGGFPHGFSYDFPKMFPFKPLKSCQILYKSRISHDFPMIYRWFSQSNHPILPWKSLISPQDVRADREIMLAAMKFDRSPCRYASLGSRGIRGRFHRCFGKNTGNTWENGHFWWKMIGENHRKSQCWFDQLWFGVGFCCPPSALKWICARFVPFTMVNAVAIVNGELFSSHSMKHSK